MSGVLSGIPASVSADYRVRLDLHEPPRIQEPLDDDEARSGADVTEGFAMDLGYSSTMSGIHKEHPSSDDVPKRRTRLA